MSIVGNQKILVVCDDPRLHQALSAGLRETGFGIFEPARTSEGSRPSAIVLAVGGSRQGLGPARVSLLRRCNPGTAIVLVVGRCDAEAIVELLRAGAFDYVCEPVDFDELAATINVALEASWPPQRLESLLPGARNPEGLVGDSPPMQAVYSQIEKLSNTDIAVLINGPSGSGKELVARAIHRGSTRNEAKLVSVNCAAIPEALQESELFGHERGAFTGAIQRRAGKFELANGGTFFLDEVAELGPKLQAKLLRVLQDRRVHRLGAAVPIETDFRLIAATHRDLREQVRAGRFREDLYYRIAAYQLDLPPLSARKQDIPDLVAHFIAQATAPSATHGLQLSDAVIEVLQAYPWPGNVRELQNAVKYALIHCANGELRPSHLPRFVLEGVVLQQGEQPAAELADGVWLRDGMSLAELEAAAISRALSRHNGRRKAVAQELRIGRTTLYRKLQKYALEHLVDRPAGASRSRAGIAVDGSTAVDGSESKGRTP